MRSKDLQFSSGFLWGAATAAHQNEGGNTNNDFFAYEQTGVTADGTRTGLACDWWNRAEEDFDRAAALGLNALRLSVEWSRIEPEPGRWDAAALGRYREMLQALRQRGLKPMVTLHHFTNPLWLAERGGWLHEDIAVLFARYASFVVSALRDLCDTWCTLNEPWIYAAFAHILGRVAGEKGLLPFIRVTRNQLRAYAAAYRSVHDQQPHARVGLVQHFGGFEPADPASARDRVVAALHDATLKWRLVEGVMSGRLKPPFGLGLRRHPGAVNSSDSWASTTTAGIPCASTRRPAPSSSRAPAGPAPAARGPSPQDREVHPEGLERFLLELRRFGKPLYVTENGMSDAEDAVRPAFILSHLAAVHRALQQGAPVRGYFYWTLVDNYEWAEGWTTRFGLLALDPTTQERAPRPSARLFSEVARRNATTPDMVEEWAPAAMDEVFG